MLGKSAHAFVIRKSINSNVNVLNALLAFYCDCSELVYSFRIFERMVVKNVVSWNTMISGFIRNDELEGAIVLLHEMRQEGVGFDLVTLISILPSCHGSGNQELGLTIHGYAIKTSLVTDISLANAIVSMYINSGHLDAARLFFDDMPDKSVVSWNAILTGYRCHNLRNESMELFRDMMEKDQKPNYITLMNILPSCETLDQAKSIHAYTIRRMIPLETPLLTSLMITYARFGNVRSCLIMFCIGDKTSISVWNTIISAYILMKDYNAAFSFFCELLRSHTDPDNVTILNLVSACAHLNSLSISSAVLGFLLRKGLDKDVAISNALIDMHAKCGCIYSAELLFEMLPQKDTISWGVMINAYALHGDSERAMSLYSRMRLLGFKPDKITYMALLSACSRGGCIEEGKMVFEDMRREGVLPGMEHYGCMVDMLCRRGQLKEAYDIVKNLQPKCCQNMLESLLGGCISHGDYVLGEEIGRVVLGMKTEVGAAAYVIVHNIYAAAGKWVEANNVRLLMENKQFSKTPGVASVVDGNTCIR